MHGVAPQMSSSPSIVRWRSRGSLPRLHLVKPCTLYYYMVLAPLIALQLRQTPLRGSGLRGGWRRLNSVRRRQISVQGCDDLRAFADRGGNALDRPRTDVTD